MTRRPLFPLLFAALLLGGGMEAARAQQQQQQPPPQPGWIGVSIDMRTIGDRLGRRTVVVIADVQPDGPAARAGVRAGDVLLEIDGLSGPEALARPQASLVLHAGDPVRLVVSRDGRERMLEVVPADRPSPRVAPAPRVGVAAPDSVVESIMRAMDATRARVAASERIRHQWAPRAPGAPGSTEPPRASSAPHVRGPDPATAPDVPAAGVAPFSPFTPYLLGRNRVAGAEVVDLQPEMARYFDIERGVLVVDVAAGTPAALAGLAPGDVIVGLGDEPVSSIDALRTAIAHAGHRLELGIVRRGERMLIELRR